jgi:hypothetical protein
MPKRLAAVRLTASILSFLVSIGLVVLGAPDLSETLDVSNLGTQVASFGAPGGSIDGSGLLLAMSGVALFVLAVWLFCGYLHYRHEGS